MFRRILGALAIGLLLFLTGCGQTYSLQSVSISALPAGTTTPLVGTITLGAGVTANIIVNANFSNTKSEVVTAHSTFTVVADRTGADQEILDYSAGVFTLGALPDPVQSPINAYGDLQYDTSGQLTAVDPGACTETTPDGGTTIALTGRYMVTATYNGMVSQPLYVGLTSGIPAQDGSVKGGCPFDTTKATS